MWVNKDFISSLNEALRSIANGRFEYDLAAFDLFKAKKYQGTIDLLRNFQTDHQQIRSEINDILQENYHSEISNCCDQESNIYRLKKVNHNLKNLTDDLQKASTALRSKDFEIILPVRDDHQPLRNLFNQSLRNASVYVNQLNLEIDQQGKEIDGFKKTMRNREQYLGKIIDSVRDVAAGNDTVEVPWSDQNQELFNALQEVKSVFRKTVRFLADLSGGIPEMEKIPCDPDSQLGGVLCTTADSVNALTQNLSQCNQLIRRLEKEHSETNQFIEMVTYYIEGIAIGDYTQKVPFREDEPVLVAALEQVKKSFEEISTAALKAAEGDLNKENYLPEQHGLVRSAFKQMFQSFKNRQNQMAELIKEKNRLVVEGQNQLKELLDYNLRFEKQYEELSAQYEKTIGEQQEQNRVIDRLQKKSDRLEDELKALKQKHNSQSKQLRTLQDDKQRLQEANKRNSLFVKNLLSDLDKHLSKINTVIGKEQKKAETSKSSLPPVFQQLGKRTEVVRETIAKAFSDLEESKQPVKANEIELGPFIQELHLLLKDQEAESGNQILFEIEETAPQLIYSDEVRLRRILELLARHSLKKDSSGNVTCRIYRAVSDSKPGDSQPMIGFEIQGNSQVPISGQQMILEAFDGLYEIRRQDLDDVDLGLTLLRELAGVINGELHLHSVQGENDTYLLLIPLNLGAVMEDSPALVASLPKNNGNVIFILEDDTRFINAIASGFSQGQFKCLQIDSVEDAIKQAEQKLPFAVCLGMKWAGSEGLKCMSTITSMAEGARIPYVALTETAKVPEDWSNHCIGYLEKTTGSYEYQRMLERMQAYRKNYLPNLAILAQEGDLNGRVDHFLKSFKLQSEVISDVEAVTDLTHNSHLLIFSDGENPGVEIAESLVKDCRQRCPELSVISGTLTPSYLFRNRIEPVSDAFVEMDKVDDDLLYELIRLLQLSGDQPVGEKQQRMAEYLGSRNDLLKEKHALMITENAAGTMALRKQLNQLGMVIRVNTQLKNIVSGLSTQTRCDLVIINAVKSEKDITRIVTEIRTSQEHKTMPILVMSDSSQLGDEEFWREKGASYFLSNPSELQTLLSAVRVSIGSQLVV